MKFKWTYLQDTAISTLTELILLLAAILSMI